MTPKRNSQRQLGIDRAVARMLMKLFYSCYKLGVCDAHECQDEGLCRAHVEKTRMPGVFGTIDTVYEVNSDLFWQLKLCELAAIGGFSDAFDRFRRNAGKIYRNYYSVAYEVLQDAYCLGLTDYCDAPSSADISEFNHSEKHDRIRWTRQGLKTWKMDKWVNEAQKFALQRQYISAQSDAKVKAKDMHYTAFIRGIKNASAVSFDAMT